MQVLILASRVIRSLLALVPLRHDEICGGRGDDVEHEEVEDDMPVAALASNVEAEQIEHAGIHHQKHEIEKKLAGLFCCHFVCCHNCMFLKIIIGLILFGGCRYCLEDVDIVWREC